jgi:glycopeptide antibiotics resistance protein
MDKQKYWRNNMFENKANKLTNVLFIVYLIALIWIVLFKLNIHFSYMGIKRSINLIPFREPLILNGRIDFGENILNVLIFVPLGVYAGILFEKWFFGKKLFLFFIISLLLEVFQYIFGIGSSDITDIINNTIGGLIGLAVFTGIEKAFKNSVKAQKFINILAATGTILMLILLLLLKINRLWIFRK